MRITIDADPQNGQSNVNTQSLAAAAGQGGAINGGAASVAGGSTGASLKARALALPVRDGGTAPTETKH